MRITILLIFLSHLFLSFSFAQSSVYEPSIDVQHYDFTLQITDENNEIKGDASVTVLFLKNMNQVNFDLINKDESGKGMNVLAVKENGEAAHFDQNAETLKIQLIQPAKAGDTRIYQIHYQGIPADGLVFSKNKFKQRTIFADNWPNRARNWLPCVDHLSDKASVDFMVTAPEHYKVISNGVLIEETSLDDHLKFSHWREHVPLPTKVMVIGLADFAVNFAGDVDCIQVSSWVFPQDKKSGFYDYAQALEILPFFIKTVGSYAYKKLANVEAITIFGGMENASAIFYNEQSITGKRGRSEELLAHEIAHQWFGNSATESDWPHVWLSEGFATEMTHLYLENKYGHDTLVAMLQNDRKQVIAFSRRRLTPIVDTSEKKNFLTLLNANSYQKGGWVLHMLRRKLGDSLFKKSISTYYGAFAGKNASTDDLRKVIEKVSGIDLKDFFKQWLYTAGQPALDISWKYDDNKKETLITIRQTQPTLFSFPLEIAFEGNKGTTSTEIYTIKEKLTQLKLKMETKPSRLIADPNTSLLFESSIIQIK